MRADGGLRGEKEDTSLDMQIDKGKSQLRKIEAVTVVNPLRLLAPCSCVGEAPKASDFTSILGMNGREGPSWQALGEAYEW